MSRLFSPVRFGPLSLNNRIVIAPMCQYSAVDGLACDWHRMHLGNLAQSGAGLLITEAVAVEPRGRISHADLGLWDEATAHALGSVLQSVRRYSDMPIGIQLAHAGRKASTHRPWEGGGSSIPPGAPQGWQTVSASALPFAEGAPVPQALERSGIDDVVAAFEAAALRAAGLGADLVEIHAAHGYLLHQFLSPLSNRRHDDYGGSLENRMRLPLRVFDAVRAVLQENVAVGVRISATDWMDSGWDLAQSLELARRLAVRGCDVLHVSSGGLSPKQRIDVGPNYQVPFADVIRKQAGMPVIAVGLITEPAQAEAILAEGQADAVALARAILYDPRWPWHAAARLGAKIKVAPQYLRCEPHGSEGLFSN